MQHVKDANRRLRLSNRSGMGLHIQRLILRSLDATWSLTSKVGRGQIYLLVAELVKLHRDPASPSRESASRRCEATTDRSPYTQHSHAAAISTSADKLVEQDVERAHKA